MTLGARAANIAAIVRVGDPTDANILSVLDGGAMGVLVPHVDSVAKARRTSPPPAAIAADGAVSPTRRAPAASARSSFAGHMAAQDDRSPASP